MTPIMRKILICAAAPIERSCAGRHDAIQWFRAVAMRRGPAPLRPRAGNAALFRLRARATRRPAGGPTGLSRDRRGSKPCQLAITALNGAHVLVKIAL